MENFKKFTLTTAGAMMLTVVSGLLVLVALQLAFMSGPIEKSEVNTSTEVVDSLEREISILTNDLLEMEIERDVALRSKHRVIVDTVDVLTTKWRGGRVKLPLPMGEWYVATEGAAGGFAIYCVDGKLYHTCGECNNGKYNSPEFRFELVPVVEYIQHRCKKHGGDWQLKYNAYLLDILICNGKFEKINIDWNKNVLFPPSKLEGSNY